MNLPILECVEINPPGRVRSTVIWLHGLGADGNDFVPVIPELGLPEGMGVRFLFPHAPIRPVTINRGTRMRAWYDIKSVATGREIEGEHVEVSAQQLEQLIERELASGRESTSILLAGFSQGGAIALYSGLRYPKRLVGVIALSTSHPEPHRIGETASVDNRGLPIFYAHGTRDPIIPLAHAETTQRRLVEAGYAVDWHTYPMEHSVSAEEITDLSLWMQARLERCGG